MREGGKPAIGIDRPPRRGSSSWTDLSRLRFGALCGCVISVQQVVGVAVALMCPSMRARHRSLERFGRANRSNGRPATPASATGNNGC